MNLVDAEQEVDVGSFSCDIKCKIEDDERIVIIENQIEASNHDHLGKTIVYASGIGASIIIWIVKNARSEHISAIEWLNEKTDTKIAFFLVELRAIQIGNSSVAPVFEIVAQPNGFMKSFKGKDENLTRSQLGRQDFWQAMKRYIENKNIEIKLRGKDYGGHCWFALGNLHFSVAPFKQEDKIELSLIIDNNKKLFNELQERKEYFEKSLGTLEWWNKKRTDREFCRIRTYINGLSYENRDNWQDLIQKTVQKLFDFEREFKPYLK